MKFLFTILTILLVMVLEIKCECFCAENYLYILNDSCINELKKSADDYFKNSDIEILKDSRGIILRFEIKNPQGEYFKLSQNIYTKSLHIEHFLAKIKNPVIIEVHTENISSQNIYGVKNWEMSTVIANRIEESMLKLGTGNLQRRINSIGYGEFLPSKNTSYNGGTYPNRVDIIILCSISGE